ncbi:MAG TPA: hypothetical protein VLJ17_24730 [Xanthobacteraceae bacterium]|nr:hypothetical protein [Xanthobacteraceae bacterium]
MQLPPIVWVLCVAVSLALLMWIMLAFMSRPIETNMSAIAGAAAAAAVADNTRRPLVVR